MSPANRHSVIPHWIQKKISNSIPWHIMMSHNLDISVSRYFSFYCCKNVAIMTPNSSDLKQQICILY